MASILDSVKVSVATTGTGSVTPGAAVTGYLTFAEASAVNSTVYAYRIEEGNDFEIGVGTYTSAGPSFSRDTVTVSKIGGTAGTSKMNLAGNATLSITIRKAELVSWSQNHDASGFNLDFDDNTGIRDSNGNEQVIFQETASAVNQLEITNAATGNAPSLGVAGGDTNIDLNLIPKGTGGVKANNALVRTVGKETIWVPAVAMKVIGNPNFAAFAAGATNFNYIAFDASASEDATFMVAMPKSWNEGSVSYQVYWLHPATTTNFAVFWEAFVKAYSNDDAIDGASYTAIGSVTDTGGTTSDLYISDESASTAVGSAAEGDLLNFIIRRNGGNGADTLAVDAYLIGVKIHFTTNAPTDA